jgi:hypothetical protein
VRFEGKIGAEALPARVSRPSGVPIPQNEGKCSRQIHTNSATLPHLIEPNSLVEVFHAVCQRTA